VDLIADTSFLIGLWRKQSWALQFASERSSEVLGIPWVVFGEFWHGARRSGHDFEEVRQFLDLGLPLMDPKSVVMSYAEVCTEMQENTPGIYRQIGQNDLWIAATARTHNRPLVTRNIRHFHAIRELELVALDSGR